jgi:hypothetical protein
MWKPLLVGITLVLSIAVASAQNRIDKIGQIAVQENKTAALVELSNEYLVCAAYFATTAYCMGGYPAPTVPKLVRDNQYLAKTALSLAISNGGAVGLSSASVAVGSKSVTTALMQSIDNNCLKIGVLSARYDMFCKHLISRADERIAELLTRRICTGFFKCTLSSRSGE